MRADWSRQPEVALGKSILMQELAKPKDIGSGLFSCGLGFSGFFSHSLALTDPPGQQKHPKGNLNGHAN
mgnify:CR=1 FL=1